MTLKLTFAVYCRFEGHKNVQLFMDGKSGICVKMASHYVAFHTFLQFHGK